MRRRRIDILEQVIAGMLKKYVGSIFAALLAKAISRFAKDLAKDLFDKWIEKDPNEYEDNEHLFI